ncbi:MAG TPA: hypothetical protein VMY69_09485 [Phycisphaerae bacterium]|nr:hypothetical protein [Phycisphaerae bacterium]
MKQADDGFTPVAGCRGCGLSRRRFLAGGAACAAGATGLAAWIARAAGADAAAKPRIRVAFSHTTPDKITWPNIGYDYEGRAKQLLEQLATLCPEVELLPVRAMSGVQAAQVMADDAQVDGYLVYTLSLPWDAGTEALVSAIAKAGRPMVVVEDLYAGPFSLGFNGRAEKAGWKSVCLSTSRLQDVADVLRCFQVLKQPGATADQFLEAARATYKKNIAPMGDLACTVDATPKCDVGKCLEQLRSSTILVVGGGWGSGKGIEEEFGAKVVAISHAELHEAFLKADPAEAARRADQWMKAAEKVVEPKREEIVKSGAMHLAMQEVMKKYNARAITINCLGGFYSGALQAYPCLGFVEFNNSGLVGACEGDLRSTITMLAMGYLVGRPGFISDPVIDLAKNQAIYAHCVAPTRVFGPQGAANPYHIRSHSEDRRGAAVRSLMPLGYMTTTLKFLPGQRRAVFHQGKTVANIDEDKACRTKLAAEVKGDINKLFSGWGEGWHRVTYYGDLREPLQELCKALNITLVEEA